MTTITLRTVERFVEPEFARLQRLVFADMQQPSLELASIAAEEADLRERWRADPLPTHRLGAYDGACLVGWSFGWQERGNVFYMANSGVLPAYRRRGVYSRLLAAMRTHAFEAGAIAIRSQHSVMNAAVIIAKLRAGFLITGLTQSAHMGTLVEMTMYGSAQRLSMLRSRSLPYVVPESERSGNAETPRDDVSAASDRPRR